MNSSQTLTIKQQCFVKAYAEHLNLTKAVRVAYPGMSYGTARSYGVYLKKKHPLVSILIKKIHAKILDQFSLSETIFAYKRMYEKTAWKSKTLKTTRSNGLVTKREVDCNTLALCALSKLSTLVLRAHAHH